MKFLSYQPFKTLALDIERANEITLEAYNKNTLEYIKKTPQKHLPKDDPILDWIDQALDYIEKGGIVLELGSATPRDARYIRTRGYEVQCTDATEGFVNHLKQQKENALLLDVLKDPLPKGYEMIMAVAVVPHFTKFDLAQALNNIYHTLNPGKIFAFNVKMGTGEKWITEKLIDKRYTLYWQPEEIKNFVQERGYDVAFMKITQNPFVGDYWINIIAQKPLS